MKPRVEPESLTNSLSTYSLAEGFLRSIQRGGRVKYRYFNYDGCFQVGDKVVLIPPCTPRDFGMGRNMPLVTITEDTVGVINNKAHLSSAGTTFLVANESLWEYEVRFDTLGIEYRHIPEWLLDFPPA